MAEAGLFIEWGEPVTGREAKGLQVFAEALAYYGQAEQDGRIESYETVILGPHANGLAGFTLVRASEAQVAALRTEDEFERIITRAGLVVRNVGVVDASVGEGVQDAVGVYQAAVNDLT